MLTERSISRMNVALTRARSSIWILGDATKLRSNQYWGQLISDAETRNMFRKVKSGPDRPCKLSS